MRDKDKKHLTAFGSAIRERRHEQGLSQEALGVAAGLHRTYIADVERGSRNLSLINILRLSEALSLPTSRLFEDYIE